MRKLSLMSLIFVILILFCVLMASFYLEAKAEEDEEAVETIDSRVLFEDDFTTDDYIDGSETTAEIDTTKGEIRLPKVSAGGTFDVTEDGIMVLNGNQMEFYIRQADGSFQQQLHYTDEQALAVAFSGQGYAHYLLKSDGTVTKMEYGADEFIVNPVVKITGLRSAVSISSSQGAVYVGDSKQVLLYEETESGILASGQIDFDERLSHISAGPTREIVASTSEGIHVLRLSEFGYINSPFEELSGASFGDINELGWLAGLNDDNVQVRFEPNGEILSFNHAGAVALKMAGNSIFVRDGDSITEYVYDGTSMVQAGRISGLTAAKEQYLSPRQYQSKVINLSDRKPIKKFGVVAEVDTPEPTKITFELSPDGIQFILVEDGTCELPVETNQVIIRATLSNEEEKTLTPILKKITLYDRSLGIESFEVTRIVRDPGGNPPLPTAEPVNVWGGYNFDMKVTVTGAVEVTITFSNGEEVIALQQDETTFTATHHFPEDAAVGSVSVTVKARDEDGNEVTLDLPDQFILVDNILNNYKVYHIK